MEQKQQPKPQTKSHKPGMLALEGHYTRPKIYAESTAAADGCYPPPVDLTELAKLVHKSALHGSALAFKAGVLDAGLVPHRASDYAADEKKPWWKGNIAFMRKTLAKQLEFQRFLPSQEFYRFVLDYLTFGNGYLLKVDTKGKKTARLQALPAVRVRVMEEKAGTPQGYAVLKDGKINVKYSPEQVIHLLTPCAESDYYGLPTYLGAIDDILLGHALKKQRGIHYDNNGFVRGLLLMNIDPGELETNEKGEKVFPAEQAWMQQINVNLTPGKPGNLMINLRGDESITDLAKVVSYVPLSNPLNGDDAKTTLEEVRKAQYEAHQVPPELLGAALDPKAAPNLSKLMEAFYTNIMAPSAMRAELAVNGGLGMEQWIEIRPKFLAEAQQAKDEAKVEAGGEAKAEAGAAVQAEQGGP